MIQYNKMQMLGGYINAPAYALCTDTSIQVLNNIPKQFIQIFFSFILFDQNRIYSHQNIREIFFLMCRIFSNFYCC